MTRFPCALNALSVTLLWLLCSTPSHAQDIDPAFRADIVKLMDIVGSAKIAHQMASMISQQMLQAFKSQHPDAPARSYDIAQQVVEKEFSAAFDGPDGLLAQIIPIYAKHFTHEDVQGLIAFYQSPLGQKSIAVMPALLQDSVALSQKWAASVGPRVQKDMQDRLQAEGLVKGQ
jgi:hypothetical protein